MDSILTDIKIKRGFVSTSNGQIHYRVAGEGKPLFLLHPSPFSSRRFIPLLPLMGRYRRVYALDTPGYGESYRPVTQPSLQDYADAIVEAMDGLGYVKAPVYGDLTGAMTALATAIRHPDRISALALGVISFVNKDATVIESRRKSIYPVGFHSGPIPDDGSHLAGLYRKISESGLHRTHPDDVVPPDRITDWVLERSEMRETAIWGFEAVYLSDLAKALPKLDLPILMAQTESHGNNAQTANARALIKNYEIERGPSSFLIEDVGEFLADSIPRFLEKHGV
jgi:pimeloyl-ACP methyl ester carboxylesterase